MSARQSTYALMQHLGARGISLSFDEVNTLRRAQMTLRRWGEQECGDSTPYASYCITRDDDTGAPYVEWHPHDGRPMSKIRIADREAGALRRIKAICKAHGLHFYHQTDPRGCALYVDREPLPDHNYSHGVACCA